MTMCAALTKMCCAGRVLVRIKFTIEATRYSSTGEVVPELLKVCTCMYLATPSELKQYLVSHATPITMSMLVSCASDDVSTLLIIVGVLTLKVLMLAKIWLVKE